LQGDVDTVTPLAGALRFYERMRAAGNVCQLQVHEGYGHLFTPAGIPDGRAPQPDPEIEAQATAQADEFLTSLGFMR
jgi:acetyl esterase/lipase